MQYGLAFMMKIFGETLATARLYSFITYAATAAIIATVPFAVLKSRRVALITVLILLAFYFPLKLSVNATPLRLLLGILAIFHIYRYVVTGKRMVLFAAGIITGLAFVYSQENGIAAAMTAACFLILALVFERGKGGKRVRESVIFIAGTLVMIIPFIIFFISNGSLGAFIETIFGYPRYVMLGYGAVPAPDIVARAEAFFSGKLAFKHLAYSLIFWLPAPVYAITLAVIAKRWRACAFNAADSFFFMLAIYGVITFRSALGRSDGFHLIQVYAPVFLLLAYLASLASCEGFKSSTVRRLLATLVVLLIPSLFIMSHFNTRAPKEFIRLNTTGIVQKFSLDPLKLRATEKLNIPEMGGVPVRARTAEAIREVIDFKEKLRPIDEVYVFGNVPFYYFILGKTNPTRFDYPYWAATTDLQKEIISELDEEMPRFILYKMFKLDTIDGIPPHIQVPELYNYINSNYSLAPGFHYDFFDILIRNIDARGEALMSDRVKVSMFLLVISIAFCWGIFGDLYGIGVGDWDQHLFYHGSSRKIITGLWAIPAMESLLLRRKPDARQSTVAVPLAVFYIRPRLRYGSRA